VLAIAMQEQGSGCHKPGAMRQLVALQCSIHNECMCPCLLPQRRRTAEDLLNMRKTLREGDLVSVSAKVGLVKR
jgi:hypothetical protein